MNKKSLIILSVASIIIIAILIYLICIIKPTEDYIAFENKGHFFYEISDNGNEIKITTYSSSGLISSEQIYTFENNSLKELTIIDYCKSILQAKISKKEKTYSNTTSYREKNKIIYTYTQYDLYGSDKETVLNSLNNFTENVINTNK